MAAAYGEAGGTSKIPWPEKKDKSPFMPYGSPFTNNRLDLMGSPGLRDTG